MELQYINITRDNIIEATKFELELFPDECGYNSFLDAYKNGKPYFMVYDKGIFVGICGLYENPELGEPKTAWLGWYGVSSKQRCKGYGKQILLDMIKKAKDKGFDTFRLYTSKVKCPEAMYLYEKVMDFGEPYTLEETELERYVFTKSLTKNPASKWNNRSLKLYQEKERESNGREIFNSILNEHNN